MAPTAKRGLALILLVSVLVAFAVDVLGDPSGATISNNTTESGPTAAVGSQTTERSTITTMVLDSTQQDQFWKAYVGNVTGVLSLDDADSNTIYDWALATITGEVYATRSNTPDWSTVECANSSIISTENTFHNMTDGQVDNINGTFNDTGHLTFETGTNTLVNDTCPSAAMFVNDTRQVANSSADFQEILVQDNSDNLVYVALINDDTNGFDNNQYDFEMIVAESNVKSSPTTYYFYLELG